MEQCYTLTEILQQPKLWLTTPANVRKAMSADQIHKLLENADILITGAGTSAYISSAIAAAWLRAKAVPSTDLLVDAERHLKGVDVVISVGRSGNSPESIAVVELVRSLRPDILQIAITCNEVGYLAKSEFVMSVLLDPRTNDKSLVMTSSFSNLVLAGYSMLLPSELESILANIGERLRLLFPELETAVSAIALQAAERIVFLSSSPMSSWSQESALKTLEMTAGRHSVMSETFLGLRHGPMSFIRQDTLVLCLLANDPIRRKYEMDLVRELNAKNIGVCVGIGATEEEKPEFSFVIPAVAPHLNDTLRTPFEIVIGQLLGLYLCRREGLDPDNPSAGGVITRVVQKFKIYAQD